MVMYFRAQQKKGRPGISLKRQVKESDMRERDVIGRNVPY